MTYVPMQRLGRCLFLAATALLLASCSGLGNEPAIVATLPPQPAVQPTAAGATPGLSQAELAATAHSRATAEANQGANTGAAAQPTGTANAPVAAAGTAAAEPTGEATAPAAVFGTVDGKVTNGTAGASVPPDLKVELHIVDAAGNDTTLTSPIAADSSYSFKDVPVNATNGYLVTARYQDRLFSSDLKTGDPSNTAMELPLTLYELTTDPAALTINSLISQVNVNPDGLEVALVLRLQNKTDKVFSGEKLPGIEDGYASASIKLPAGAQILSFAESSDRYVVSADGLTITDSVPVVPGRDHRIHVIYMMPYIESGVVIDQPLQYAVDGGVRVTVRPDGLKATLKLGDTGLVELQPQTSNGITFKQFGTMATMNVGASLRYEISGKPVAASAGDASSVAASGGVVPRELLTGILIGGGLGSILIGTVLLWRERRGARRTSVAGDTSAVPQGNTEAEALLQQLAQLDNLKASGKLGDKDYEQRRQKLKNKLARLLKA